MKKNKLILSGLFLTSVISCSNFRPLVLTNAYLFPDTTTSNTRYDDLNWTYALFNQYASGLTYKFRLNYSNSLNATDRNSAIIYFDGGTPYFFDLWDTVTSTYAEATLNTLWRNRLNTVLFNREFDRTSGYAVGTNRFLFRKFGINENTAFEIIIESKISYSVNIGSTFISFSTNGNAGITNFEKYIDFYNSNDILQQRYRLELNPVVGDYERFYTYSSITTNVNSFALRLLWIDIPPYVVGPDNYYILREFNLFTQNAEVFIPDNADGDRFGFEFVAVEWWNILGHLQNFAWWIVNQSPVAPIFEWIDTYIISWIVGLVGIIVGVFGL